MANYFLLFFYSFFTFYFFYILLSSILFISFYFFSFPLFTFPFLFEFNQILVAFPVALRLNCKRLSSQTELDIDDKKLG